MQDNVTGKVLMLGFMNEEAVAKTQEFQKVTFFSRSKNRLWTKGEESGNFLLLKEIKVDCDNDTLLIKATPVGPTPMYANLRALILAGMKKIFPTIFYFNLEQIISDRKNNPLGEILYQFFVCKRNK